MPIFRMQRITGQEEGGRPKGYLGSYRFFRDEAPFCQCHVSRWCSKPTEFVPLNDLEAVKFILRPKRRLMNFTWVVENGQGVLQGSLERRLLGKTEWRIRDANSKEVGRFRARYNPRFWLFRLGDAFFGHRPDGYEIIEHGNLVARMEREKRLEENPGKEQKGFRGLVDRVLKSKDWVIRERADAECLIDYRLLLSGAVLLENISRDTSE